MHNYKMKPVSSSMRDRIGIKSELGEEKERKREKNYWEPCEAYKDQTHHPLGPKQGFD